MAIPNGIPEPASVATNYAALMQPIDPGGTSAESRIAASPNAEFLLRHHPGVWDPAGEGLEETTWLPDIGKQVLVAGAHLVRTRRQGEDAVESFKHSRAVDAERGWTHLDANVSIPAECLPDGVPPGGYIRALKCRDPRTGAIGLRYVEAWEVPAAPRPGAPQRFRFDRAAYNRWRLWLVTSGQVAPPTEDTILEMQAAKSGRPARHASLPIPDELRKQRVALAEANLKLMSDAVVPAANGATSKKGRAKSATVAP